MNRAIRHRGPDYSGIYCAKTSSGGHVAMGHTRLSILDTSPLSHQPMVSPCGNFALIFNGEIYNYIEIRKSRLFRNKLNLPSTNDTATLLDLLTDHGTDCLSHLNGMWAFIYLDAIRNHIIVSRDRLGKKPLYYAADQGGRLFFSSEVKAIRATSSRHWNINPFAVSNFLFRSLTNYNTDTFFEDIRQVPHGHYAKISTNITQPIKMQFVQYWSHPFQRCASVNHSIDFQSAAHHLRDLLYNSVSIRMRSDVPIGVLLSGGVDSTVILNCILKSGHKEVACYSAISNDPGTDESTYINHVSRFYGVKTHLVNVSHDPLHYFSSLSNAIISSDQPVPSLSFVVHKSLTATAQQHGIKVLLNGQGSDEQLCGYNKFLYLHLRHLFKSGEFAKVIQLIAEFSLKRTVFRDFQLQNAVRHIPLLRKLGKSMVAGAALIDLKDDVIWNPQTVYEAEYDDITKYSLPMLLHSDDHMSMSHGIESRIPFLDYRLVEFLSTVPTRFKLHGGWTKSLLRSAFRDQLPPAINFRKDKMGFCVPQNTWLRGPLRPKIESLLSDDLLIEQLGYIKNGSTRRLFSEFINGNNTHSRLLFQMISLETWLRMG